MRVIKDKRPTITLGAPKVIIYYGATRKVRVQTSRDWRLFEKLEIRVDRKRPWRLELRFRGDFNGTVWRRRDRRRHSRRRRRRENVNVTERPKVKSRYDECVAARGKIDRVQRAIYRNVEIKRQDRRDI